MDQQSDPTSTEEATPEGRWAPFHNFGYVLLFTIMVGVSWVALVMAFADTPIGGSGFAGFVGGVLFVGFPMAFQRIRAHRKAQRDPWS